MLPASLGGHPYIPPKQAPADSLKSEEVQADSLESLEATVDSLDRVEVPD